MNPGTRPFALSFSALLMLASQFAFAGDTAVTASNRGPGGGTGGGTGTGCTYAYSIQKIGPSRVEAGEDFKYHVFVKNIGTCRLRHIDIADWLPRGFDLDSAYPSSPNSGTVNGNGKLTWEHVDLAPGRVFDISIKGHAKRMKHPYTMVNTACAYSSRVGTRICDSVSTYVYPEHDAAAAEAATMEEAEAANAPAAE